jgi:YfiR/HmsC-like
MALLNPRQHVTGVVLVIGLARLAAAQGQTVDEYQVKAAFLYNFAKFVEWPAGEFKSPGDPIVICVLGRNPFGPLLEQAIMGKQIDGRSLLTREVSGIRECGGCNLLFIGASEKKRWPAVLESLKTDSVLTVGETVNFAAAGGIINFKRDAGKVSFEINVYAAQRARLKISSKLLSLAKIIKDDKP